MSLRSRVEVAMFRMTEACCISAIVQQLLSRIVYIQMMNF